MLESHVVSLVSSLLVLVDITVRESATLCFRRTAIFRLDIDTEKVFIPRLCVVSDIYDEMARALSRTTINSFIDCAVEAGLFVRRIC